MPTEPGKSLAFDKVIDLSRQNRAELTAGIQSAWNEGAN